MMWAIFALYERVTGRVRCPGGLSDHLVSSIGVKQGCPLSPTLFGLYIDERVDFIQRKGGDGVEIGGTMVHILLYADDIVLVSKSAKRLQQHLRALDDFCAQRGMTMNLGKTKVLIFHTSPRVRSKSSFTVAGGDIEVKGSYVYLGVTFTAASGAFSMAQAARARLISEQGFIETPAYMQVYMPQRLRIAIGQLQVSSHQLAIESGRARGIPREERVCQICRAQVKNEEHLVL